MTHYRICPAPVTAALIALLIAGFTGCAVSVTPPPKDQTTRARDEGYSLLYKLMDDESDVGKVFIIKHADDPLKDLVRAIGKECASAKKRLEEFKRADSSIRLTTPDLPYIEYQSRKLQEQADTGALLHSSGGVFEVRLIFTQAEAMNYAEQLSRTLADMETNADRKEFLGKLASRCASFHSLLMKMLAYQKTGGK